MPYFYIWMHLGTAVGHLILAATPTTDGCKPWIYSGKILARCCLFKLNFDCSFLLSTSASPSSTMPRPRYLSISNNASRGSGLVPRASSAY